MYSWSIKNKSITQEGQDQEKCVYKTELTSYILFYFYKF